MRTWSAVNEQGEALDHTGLQRRAAECVSSNLAQASNVGCSAKSPKVIGAPRC